MAINNLVKRLQNIMRQDAGVNGDAQRIEQMVWLMFLKVYDTQEQDWKLDDTNYKSIIPEPLQWHNWAPSKDDEGHAIQSITGTELLQFIDNTLFPVLKGQNSLDGTIKGIRVNKETPRGKAVVQEVFMEVNNYMKNGVLLRQMIDVIDEVDLTDPDDSHTFANIYEQILKDLQGAGRAGEFYTPRALTDLIIFLLHPKLGETVGDWAMGTGGFLTSALNYLDKQCKTAEDRERFQNAVEGQEWKPFPYLLAVTNLLLHGIENPKLYHMDSLGVPMTEYNHEGKVNVIAMNPPYGGATDATTKMNFKAEFRSSETADLFMVLIMQRLEKHGRAGVILPDGFLFGTDGPKLAIKRKLLTDFNLHTIIRLPGSIFSPYTSIATNILFFDNERADDAPEEMATKDVWFYRMDMPEGYKHFSKTRPMLFEHTKPIRDWWNNRQEIILGDGDEKSRCFSAQELLDIDCNFDQCKFPKEEDEVLRPKELLKKYHEQRASLDATIDRTLNEVENMLGIM
ncbi:MAG: class I SAM-dependent DNA methyltransferase [Prevotella sp.]|nr:class I SAM-dependent DNA methyltransferase [Prevotella sp.]MDY4625672.1 class I SAM-dependent DNA methyltransferase [Prevotella sp.]